MWETGFTEKKIMNASSDGSKSQLDLILYWQERKIEKALDINVFRGEGMAVSNHCLVVAKMKCLRKLVGRILLLNVC